MILPILAILISALPAQAQASGDCAPGEPHSCVGHFGACVCLPVAHLVSGLAETTGTQPGDCSFAPPPFSVAEQNAEFEAAELCRAEGGEAVRTTPFTHSANLCVWGGTMYRYARDTVYAQAEYRCE